MKSTNLVFLAIGLFSFLTTSDSFAWGKKDTARKPAGVGALSCTDNAAGPDNGYSVYISKNGKRADVQETTIAGAHTVATLSCSPPDQPEQPGGDKIVVALSCAEPSQRDNGYSLTVSSGGLAGLTTAVLSEVTIAGATSVARLSCKSGQ